MRLSIKQINFDKQINFVSPVMFFKDKKYFKNETILLEKNENSYLVDMCKNCTQEFFNNVFDSDGPFWNLYENVGFAIRPTGLKYANFIYGRLYFSKNIENIFIKNIGTEKYYEVNGDYLFDRTEKNITNLFLAFSYPFDLARQFTSMIRFGFLANESILNYEKFHKKTMEFYNFYSDENNISNPMKTAKESLNRAVEAVGFLNIALLSYKLKVKLKKSETILNCELERLSHLIEIRDYATLANDMGFYSISPYDISVRRIREDISNFENFRGFKVPDNYALKWRENAKFLCARYLDIQRRCYLKIGSMTGLGDLIFYLKTAELNSFNMDDQRAVENFRIIAGKRKSDHENNKLIELDQKIVFSKNRLYNVYDPALEKSESNFISGQSVSDERIVEGPIININSFEDFSKEFNGGSIILSKGLSPNLAMLYGKAGGIISESAGMLSHAAIIAREMKIPCILQARIPMILKDGQNVLLNGKTGKIKILGKEDIDNYKTTHVEVDAEAKLPQKEAAIIENEIDKIIINKEFDKDVFWINEQKLKNSIVGAKAFNLSALLKSFSVPNGFVLGSELFRKLIQFKSLKAIIDDMHKTDKADIKGLNGLYASLKDIMIGAEFSKKLKIEIEENYKLLSSSGVAVRSSASCEDSNQNSFAGQFDSYLHIKDMKSLELAIKKCWASFFTPRAVIYRKENKIDDNVARMAILIQKMIDAKYSGVMFTMDVKNVNAISIEVVPETCEKLVSGDVKPNLYVLDRENISVLKVNMSFDLDDKIILEIANEGMKIEKAFGKPQDIEWCIDNEDKLWIVQSRPITAD